MSSSNSRNIDEVLNDLESKSNDELFNIIGAYALSQSPQELQSSLAINGYLELDKIHVAGRQFIADLTPVIRDAICGPDGLVDNLDDTKVKDVVALLLPALGIATSGVIPIAIIAMCFIIVRSGVRAFCSDSMGK